MELNQIKTFEDACAVLKLDASKLPDVSMLPEKHQKALIAHYKLIIIAQAINNGWEPDWNDDDQYKYYPWFWVKAKADNSGLGLSYLDYAYTNSDTSVGSRLCFPTREAAKYAGETFTDLYEEYFLIK